MTDWRAHARILPLLALSPAAAFAQSGGGLTELDAFISEEVAAEDSDSLMPTQRTVDSAFFDNMSLLETPRSVLSISPEAMKQFQIRDFSDLEKIGAGTERQNFYGIAGSPMIRGWIGGNYFNGMLRAYQRNEMPTSFGSLEALNIVKGPAPAQLVPSQVGGYANMIPKSPYFDEFRGSLQLEIGSYDHYNIQADIGGPTLIGETPVAYRLSLTGQQSGSYYDRVQNDYISLYGAIKARLSDELRLFAGAEYYQFKSNENAGWNRPTQSLINEGSYVIGEPLSLVRAGNGGYADRIIIDALVNGGFAFPWASPPDLFGYAEIDASTIDFADFRALVVPQAIVDEAVASGAITGAQRDLMKNMADPTVRAATYGALPDDIAQTTSGYLYTPEYFQGGGSVFTEQIEGSTVLSDTRDYADSENFMFFADLELTLDSGATVENKVLIDYLKTDKLSSYGYSFRTEQFIFDDRLTYSHQKEFSDTVSLTYSTGVQLRYSEATQLQDFWTEPFARRDITRDQISSNSVILSGAQTDPLIGGNNYWSGGATPYGNYDGPSGSAVGSELLQTGAFLTTALDMTEYFTLIAGFRGETASFDSFVPTGPTNVADREVKVDIDYFNWSLNPVLKISPMVSFYGVLQEATTVAPTQGGAFINEGNFGEAELLEGGVKVSLLEDTLYASLAYYEWEQTSFSDREEFASQFESEGVEFEVVYQPLPNLTFIASYTDRETRKNGGLGFRTMPWSLGDPTGAGNDEIGVALEGGALYQQFSDAFGGFTPEGASPSGNPDLVVPGSPEQTYKFFGRYQFDSGFGVGASVRHRSDYFHNYDRTLVVPSATIVDLNLSYEAETYEILFVVQNLTDEDYFIGADPEFGANTLITKGEALRYDLTFTYFF